MKAKVQLLDQNTSNQIAAGEVVEKPMSVVKELVENALDAGATHVDVTIYEGGTEYIRVKDNGSGMDEENARLAVLRHATSKIVKAEDLLTLKTLGFRGEALPSIASVSHFNLLTREEGAEFATSITIDGGENMSVDVMGGDVGTTVTVKDLFYNVPARRKFCGRSVRRVAISTISFPKWPFHGRMSILRFKITTRKSLIPREAVMNSTSLGRFMGKMSLRPFFP